MNDINARINELTLELAKLSKEKEKLVKHKILQFKEECRIEQSQQFQAMTDANIIIVNSIETEYVYMRIPHGDFYGEDGIHIFATEPEVTDQPLCYHCNTSKFLSTTKHTLCPTHYQIVKINTRDLLPVDKLLQFHE